MGYWKDKVVPKFKKVFEKNGTKKAAAAEAIKVFDESKEQYTKEFEEKKMELQPKVVEIYEASSTEIKALVKEPKEAGLKKQSSAVQKLLDELSKIEFPGAKSASESSLKFGPAYVTGPIAFVFEKVSTFVVTQEKKEEAPASEVAAATTEVAEKDLVVEEEKKEFNAEAEAETSTAEKTEAPAETTAETAPPTVAAEAAEPAKA